MCMYAACGRLLGAKITCNFLSHILLRAEELQQLANDLHEFRFASLL